MVLTTNQRGLAKVLPNQVRIETVSFATNRLAACFKNLERC
jgi:hypothetical protein